MPYPLSSYINNWRSDYVDVSNTLWASGSYLKNAATALNLEMFGVAASNLNDAGERLHDAALSFNIGSSNIHDNMYTAMDWINDNWPSNGEAYELDMDKILDAIWDSDKLRWFHFINYIDSMRAGIWNVQIYEKHLEDWYRHFSI